MTPDIPAIFIMKTICSVAVFLLILPAGLSAQTLSAPGVEVRNYRALQTYPRERFGTRRPTEVAYNGDAALPGWNPGPVTGEFEIRFFLNASASNGFRDFGGDGSAYHRGNSSLGTNFTYSPGYWAQSAAISHAYIPELNTDGYFLLGGGFGDNSWA